MSELLNIEDYNLPAEIAQTVTTDQAWHYGIIPKEKKNNKCLQRKHQPCNEQKKEISISDILIEKLQLFIP